MPLSHPVSPKYTEGPGKVKTFCQQDPFSKVLRPAMNDLEVALLSPKHWQHRLTWVNSKKNTMIYCQENMPATWTFAVPYRYDARRFLQFCPGYVLDASFCWHFVGCMRAQVMAAVRLHQCLRLFTVLDALTYLACSHVKRDCLNWLQEGTSSGKKVYMSAGKWIKHKGTYCRSSNRYVLRVYIQIPEESLVS